MIYKFRMISGDETAFLREYEVDSNTTFLNFHNFIQKDLEFDSNQLASFFLADEQWNKGMELTLIDMENDAGPAAIPMDSLKINDLLKNKKERLLYVFDIFSERCFFIELSNIFQKEDDVTYPRCIASIGNAPEQVVVEEVSIEDIFSDEETLNEIINDIGLSDTDINPDDYFDKD